MSEVTSRPMRSDDRDAMLDQSAASALKLQRAVGLHQRGELKAAEAVYLEILDAEPGHWEALQLLGVVALQAGQWVAGAELIERSLSIEPRQAQAWSNLGDAQLQLGRMEVALQSYAHAAALSPQWVEVLSKQALVLRRLNRPEQALQCYEQALSHQPQLAAAWSNRGSLLLTMGRAADALMSIERALELREGSWAEGWNTRGTALSQLRRWTEALSSYEHALRLQPQHADAHNNRGNVLLELRREEEALASYDEALRVQPQFADAWNNRGTVLLQLRRLPDALDSYERALAIKPDAVGALNGRASVLRLMNRFDEARASCERALTLEPDFAEAYNTRANILLQQGWPVEALADLDTAIRLNPHLRETQRNRAAVLLRLERCEEALAHIDRLLIAAPDDAEAMSIRGVVLARLQRTSDALTSYQSALQLAPGLVAAMENRGALLAQLGRTDEALADFDRALQLQPDCAAVLGNRASALAERRRYPEAIRDYKRLLEIAPDYDYARGNLLHTQMLACDWSDHADSASSIAQSLLEADRVIEPFLCLSVTDDPALQLRCARSFVSRIADIAVAQRRPTLRTAARDGRIRVAYVSGDLREHAVSYLMAGVWEKHDRERFEVVAFSLRPAEASRMGKRAQAAFDRFIDVSARSDEEVIELARQLHIDIAVDLVGYTQGRRPAIFARRAAPVQVNYLGHPGTLGADYIDYMLADEFVIPPEHSGDYSESTVRLPDCFQANDDRRVDSGSVPSRATLGLPEDGLVWCSFNNNYKLTPRFFDVWMRLLQAIPASVLWLLGNRDCIQDNLRREAVRRGVNPSRLVFAGHASYPDHLSRLQQADIFLDNLPFNGGTTVSDALWAAVPVVTCAGRSFAARMAGSLLNAAGLTELITSALEDYEALALRLARDPHRLARMKTHLSGARRTSPLFDTARFCRHLESAYTTMHQRQQRGESPTSFAVGRIPDDTSRLQSVAHSEDR